MEEQNKKVILDIECINCIHFFNCTGKERTGQLCVRFKERTDQDG